MAFMTPEDVQKLLATAQDTPYYTLIYAALYTGMRRGELLGLRWCDVDLDMATLSVVQSLQRRYGGEFLVKEPKSSRGRRLIALPPSLAILLRQHKAQQDDVRKLLGLALAETDLVFAHLDASPLDPSTISHAFGRITRKAGLPNIRFHDLRHTHASLMLRNGVHPKIVSERLGHSSIAITLDTYSHVLPGLQEAAALRFEDALQGTRQRQPAHVG